MKRYIWIAFCVILLMTIGLSGCQENSSNNGKSFEGIALESDIVELAHASKEFIKDDNEIIRVEVQYLFKNIARRDIQFKVFAEFYDKNNNLLNTSSQKEFIIPDGYTETSVLPANIISYDGEDCKQVDHITIKTIEI
ncbi:hypothetical protein AYK24_08995 [Thermoplasmatales archaeon SG8-52-4]|nr:MAG: hypothetical protein AYK24_08995 [Thermoplasmatales archaeon SG8-52-4]